MKTYGLKSIVLDCVASLVSIAGLGILDPSSLKLIVACGILWLGFRSLLTWSVITLDENELKIVRILWIINRSITIRVRSIKELKIKNENFNVGFSDIIISHSDIYETFTVRFGVQTSKRLIEDLEKLNVNCFIIG